VFFAVGYFFNLNDRIQGNLGGIGGNRNVCLKIRAFIRGNRKFRILFNNDEFIHIVFSRHLHIKDVAIRGIIKEIVNSAFREIINKAYFIVKSIADDRCRIGYSAPVIQLDIIRLLFRVLTIDKS
jgi:hypothetical protein